MLSDKVQDQIKGRHRARTGQAGVVDDISFSHGFNLGKAFGEIGQLFPVDGRLIAVEQSGFGQKPAAGVHGAKGLEPSCCGA